MEQRTKRSHETAEASAPTSKVQKTSLETVARSLYGKMSASPKKLHAHMLWKSGESFDDIAKRLRVAEATAEVYVVDILAQGQAEDSDSQKILQDLNVGNSAFCDVRRLIKPDHSLREIRDKTGLKYNQIRAVIAALINGYDL